MRKLLYNERILSQAFMDLQLDKEVINIIHKAIINHSGSFSEYLRTIYAIYDSRFVNLYADEAYAALGAMKVGQLMREFCIEGNRNQDVLVADPYDLIYNLSTNSEVFGKYNSHIYDESFCAIENVSSQLIATDLVEDMVNLTSFVSDKIEQMILSSLLSKESELNQYCHDSYAGMVIVSPEVINRNLIMFSKLSD